jgi:hypothetical protein
MTKTNAKKKISKFNQENSPQKINENQIFTA